MDPRDSGSAEPADKHNAVRSTAHRGGRNDGPSDEQPIAKWIVEEQFDGTIEAARQGSRTALGRLFEGCRNYLLLVANRELGESIQAKIGASDLVQETLLQGQQIFERFDGSSQKELLAWLAQILELKSAQAVRRYVKTEMREVGREVPIAVVGSSLAHDHRRTQDRSPDSALGHFEKLERLKAAIARLPDDYRLAIELRGLQEKSFAELASEMQRSVTAVRKIWIRAVQRLGVELRTIGMTDHRANYE